MAYVLLALSLSGGYPYEVSVFERQYTCEQAREELLKTDTTGKFKYICVRR